MDNPLTPKKIQRLIQMAEDKSSPLDRRVLFSDVDLKLLVASQAIAGGSNYGGDSVKYESSSGILDIDEFKGFGESGSIANVSLSNSTAFNPGEMTGRSTGAEDPVTKSTVTLNVPRIEEYGRHSMGMDNLVRQMDKQTNEINDIMRHSIASNYSFHSKPNLTADEASLIAREAPIPMQLTHTNFLETSVNHSANNDLSMGSYFKKRCPDFGNMLAKTESPNKSSFMMPSITEVSSTTQYDYKDPNPRIIDDSLDCVPVRQPRATQKSPEKPIQQSNLPVFKEPARPTEKKEVSKIPQPKTLARKAVPSTAKPTDVLLNHLQQQSTINGASDDTESSENNSLSLSKIADYLDRQSNVSITELMRLNLKKTNAKKQPLSELHMNTPTIDEEVAVTQLSDTKKGETASSTATASTVIALEKLNIKKNIPEVVVTSPSLTNREIDEESNLATRSKSTSTKSHSTLSTVRENHSSFKYGESPDSSKGEANRSKVPSPNVQYKELDKSVDWQEVLLQKQLRRVAKEQWNWADIVAQPVEGYVGVSCPVTITVTTHVDSWLTAKIQFADSPQKNQLSVELPRLPLLLSPGKSEQFTFSITTNVEMNTNLPFTVFLKDASTDGDIEERRDLKVNFKLPVIQAMSADGLNKITYPTIPEKSSATKSFVIISDCPSDLQLKLAIVEGDSIFCIKSVQEIKKSDVNKVLLERQNSDDHGKGKSKPSNKQLCRLAQGNAIKVSITFNSPRLADLQISSETKVTFNGALNVNLISGDAVLKRVDLVGVVGTPALEFDVPGNKLHVTNEPIKLTVTNTGTLAGCWLVKRSIDEVDSFPLQVSPTMIELSPGASMPVTLIQLSTADATNMATLFFEEVTTGIKKALEVTVEGSKPTPFPIKTNHNIMSWVRPGRKEICLKNTLDKKVYIRIQIQGEGFSIDLPGAESRGVYMLPFEARECRTLSLVFAPNCYTPCIGSFHLVHDRTSDTSRKVKLFGCNCGESVRWSGLVTYSDTALVRAVHGQPIELKLYNKSPLPAFVAARVHFNLQYLSLEQSCSVTGARRVVGGRARHCVTIGLQWPRLQRLADDCASTALASVTVLTGAELTRRRILRVLREESGGEPDLSLLPPHLHMLAGQFEGEDPALDDHFKDFTETKVSLSELIGGLQELTAYVDLPQDFGDENTIIISDETVIDYHTLLE